MVNTHDALLAAARHVDEDERARGGVQEQRAEFLVGA